MHTPILIALTPTRVCSWAVSSTTHFLHSFFLFKILSDMLGEVMEIPLMSPKCLPLMAQCFMGGCPLCCHSNCRLHVAQWRRMKRIKDRGKVFCLIKEYPENVRGFLVCHEGKIIFIMFTEVAFPGTDSRLPQTHWYTPGSPSGPGFLLHYEDWISVLRQQLVPVFLSITKFLSLPGSTAPVLTFLPWFFISFFKVIILSLT